MILLGVVPSLDQAIAHRVRRGLVSTSVIEIKASSSKSVLDMIYNGSLDGALITSNVRAHKRPHLLLTLRGWLAKLRSVERLCLILAVALGLLFGHIEARVLAHNRLLSLAFVTFCFFLCGSLGLGSWLSLVNFLLSGLLSSSLLRFLRSLGGCCLLEGATLRVLLLWHWHVVLVLCLCFRELDLSLTMLRHFG